MRDRVVAGRLATTKSNVLLLGPRQVGKSTICRNLRAQVYVDLADEAEFLGYAKDPARLRREVDALPPGSLVVVDEVQRVPALLNTVQSLAAAGAFVSCSPDRARASSVAGVRTCYPAG